MGKDKKKHKRKTMRRSSSDSSSEEEWVEMASSSKNTPTTQNEGSKEVKARHEIDEWISNDALFPCVSRKDIRQKKEKENDKSKDNRYMLDKLGQTDKELNPYWKDGGAGLPPEKTVKPESLRQASVTVGDQGVNWLRKALQRAKEQAVEQGRTLENVVAERWGSLTKLENMIAEAEQRERHLTEHNHRNREKCYYDNRYKERLDSKTDKDSRNKTKDYNQDKVDKSFRMGNAKPAASDEEMSDNDEKFRKKFHKHRKQKHHSDYRERSNAGKNKYGVVRKRLSNSSTDSDGSFEDNKHSKTSVKTKDGSGRNARETSSTKHKMFAKPTDECSDSSDAAGDYLSNRRNKYLATSSSVSKNSSDKYSSKRHRSKERFAKPSESSSEDDKHSTLSSGNKNRHGKNSCDESQRRQRDININYSTNSNHKKGDKISSIKDFAGIRSEKSYSSSTGWRKKTMSQDEYKKEIVERKELVSKVANEDNSSQVIEEESPLTDKEMNDLGAKIVKAEILGNMELANELKAKLDTARKAKANKQGDGVTEKVVLLTHIDSKGFERPVTLAETSTPSGGRRKSKKVETHSEGKRMRYFADDDKYSLQDMFQREKLSTVEDSNEVFAKLASKGIGRDESARDMEDVFEETACVEESENKIQARDRDKAIQHSKRVARTLENCQWCLESKHMMKHLIIAIGQTCYLCVPPHQSLTENHCLIVPNCHVACATQLDEDVWTEIKEFRKSLVQMFLSQDEDIVFFESARYPNKFPHMVLNCVPMPKETGDLAPIYFKKAIQECEMEWSNNKKLVELKGRDVRRAVPKGLPYFAVDFGLESGFAHVIEDEKLFPHNFAQEIIGGMLDLDHTIWRKERKQTFEEQNKKVLKLINLWSPFNCTKKI